MLARLMAMLPVYKLKGYNILHAHGASGKSFTRKKLIMRWARFLGFKTIFHCHGGGFADYAGQYGLEKIAAELNRCAAVVTLSRGWAATFTGRMGINNVKVINNVVEPPSAYTSTRNLHSPLTGLFLGKLCRDKGVYVMLDAIAANKDRLEGRLKIMVGGNGEVAEFTQRVKAAGLDNIIEYLGWVGAERKEQVLAAADFIILPSYIEGMPVSILEGAARAIPAVATAVGGVPELLDDGCNGIMINPGKPDEIASALLQYINNPGLVAAHGQAARDKVKPFLPDSVVASLRDLYSSIL